MRKIDLNKLADRVARREGKKKSVLNAGQAREAVRLVLQELFGEWKSGNESGVVDLITGSSDVRTWTTRTVLSSGTIAGLPAKWILDVKRPICNVAITPKKPKRKVKRK